MQKKGYLSALYFPLCVTKFPLINSLIASYKKPFRWWYISSFTTEGNVFVSKGLLLFLKYLQTHLPVRSVSVIFAARY